MSAALSVVKLPLCTHTLSGQSLSVTVILSFSARMVFLPYSDVMSKVYGSFIFDKSMVFISSPLLYTSAIVESFVP